MHSTRLRARRGGLGAAFAVAALAQVSASGADHRLITRPDHQAQANAVHAAAFIASAIGPEAA